MRYAIIGATVQQVQSAGGTDVKEAPFTGIIFATATESQANQLKAQGCSVIPVKQVRPSVMPPTPITPIVEQAPVSLYDVLVFTGLEELRNLIDPPLYGKNLTVAIIDTGIREAHEMIGGRVVYSENFTSDTMQDGFDHGTAVASVVVITAPQVNLLNFKALDNEGVGTEEDVVMAISKSIALIDDQPAIAPHVINMSLGTPDDGNINNPLRVACRAAIENGIWVVAAAGNDGPTPGTVQIPACEEYVAAIGACGIDPFVVPDFSAQGPTAGGLIKPDVVAPGVNIELASSSSSTAKVNKSGTSFAAPFISAFVALHYEAIYRGVRGSSLPEGIVPVRWWEFPEWTPIITPLTPEEVIDEWGPLICTKPENVPPTVKDNASGFGMPYAPMLMRMLAPGAAVTDILSAIMPIMLIGMMMPMFKSMR